VADGLFEGLVPVSAGGSVHVRAHGTGPALVFCNGLGVSTHFWRPAAEAFAPGWRAVTWDYRGHGASGPAPAAGFSIRACAEDLLGVMDALGIESAVLAGHSMGSQVILEAYRLAPGRVRGLVPTLGGYGRTVESFFGTKWSWRVLKAVSAVVARRPREAQALVRLGTSVPGAFAAARRLGIVDAQAFPREEELPYLAHMAGLDLGTFFQLATDLQLHDASGLLPEVRVPVLVFGADRDLFTPLSLSETMAARIPGAELCVLRGGSHAALVEQPELLCLRLERFLLDRVGGPPMAHPPRAT
jgi:pimeloyl-ACP methyl ester carboxylesterase